MNCARGVLTFCSEVNLSNTAHVVYDVSKALKVLSRQSPQRLPLLKSTEARGILRSAAVLNGKYSCLSHLQASPAQRLAALDAFQHFK